MMMEQPLPPEGEVFIALTLCLTPRKAKGNSQFIFALNFGLEGILTPFNVDPHDPIELRLVEIFDWALLL